MPGTVAIDQNTPNIGWIASLKALLFGYDFFISYSQEEAARAYGEQLQAMLARRDYVVFRDVTELHAGDDLTIRIRWCLWRTRCLIVLATERAIASDWVKKEIGIFSERKRRIVPLDLQSVRTRHPWTQINDALFEIDSLPVPSTRVVDKLVASLRGWRANKLARLVFATVAVAALAAAGILMWQALNLRERALRMRTQSLVAIAQSLPDPLVRSLVLAEADVARLPDDAVRTAREIARSAVPETVLRVSGESISAMTISLDDRWVLTADEASNLRRWPIDGKSDPVALCKLDWRPDRIDALASMMFCCDDSHAALVQIDHPGEPKIFAKPEDEESDEAKEDRDKPETARWQVAHRPTAWRSSSDGRMVAFCADENRVVAFIQGEKGEWREAVLPVPGRAVLDIWIRPKASDGSFHGDLVCTDGSHATFICSNEDKFEIQWRLEALVSKDEHVRFPDRVADARAIYADGSIIVAGLGSDDGIVTASRANNWTPRIFRPPGGRKLKAWIVADDGRHALLQWENAEASHLQLEDFREAPQPPSTRIRVLTQSDYAMGIEGRQSDAEDSKPPEMRNPALSPNGDLVLLPTLRNAWLWSVKAGHPVATLRAGLFFDDGIRPAFSHDGARFVTADRAGEMRVWRTDGNGLDPRVVGLGGQTVKFAVGQGWRVLAGTAKGEVFLIDATKQAAPQLLHRRPGQMARCAVSPMGQRGAAIFADGFVALFDLADGSLKGTVQCEKQPSESATYEDVEFIGLDHVIAFNGVTPSLIEFATQRITAQSKVAWSTVETSNRPDAKVLLVKTAVDAIELVRLPDLKSTRTLRLPANAKIWGTALSPTGALAALGLEDGRILVFDIATDADPVSITVDDEKTSVDCVAIDGADRHVAFGTFDGKVGIADLRRPAKPRWFQAPNLEQSTGLARNNHGHLGVVSDLRFSPDGQRLVTCGGMDGFTRVWQLDGMCVEALNTAGVATFAHLLEDGRLVNLTEQGEIAFWRVGVRALLDHLSHRSNATLLSSERIRYLTEDPATAYERYCAQERQRGRTPLPRDIMKIDYR
jgi:WD40 repeat protein